MNTLEHIPAGLQPDNLHLHDMPVAATDMRSEVLQGLRLPQKQLSPKFFYDATGSELFEQITALPEYYPTRTEQQIMRQFGSEIFSAINAGSVLIEPGSGGCHKIQPLLEANGPSAYVPIEISRDALYDAATALARAFPATEFHAICADFTQPMQLPRSVPDAHRMVFFPGSTIGNFEPTEAVGLLRRLRDMMQGEGQLLVGVDTHKDTALLDAAYNDSAGVTAAFNRNMLHHLNQSLGCDFQPDRFDHLAFYNEDLNRIEMHLRSRGRQQVQIGDEWVQFEDGETLHTENSYKYRPQDFQRLAADAGFSPLECWQDDQSLFSVHLMTCN